MRQKYVFAQTEGTAWFSSDASDQPYRMLPQSDYFLLKILKPPPGAGLLQVNFGDGTRLIGKIASILPISLE
jgi:hypothetical protein